MSITEGCHWGICDNLEEIQIDCLSPEHRSISPDMACSSATSSVLDVDNACTNKEPGSRGPGDLLIASPLGALQRCFQGESPSARAGVAGRAKQCSVLGMAFKRS